MSTDLGTYRRDLIMALRLRDVPGERIGEIVAEVESHVADTGEDPRDAFGPPKEYAAGLSGVRRPRWGRDQLLLAVASGLGGFLVAAGVLGLVQAESVGPLPAWAALALGLAIGVPTAVHAQRSSSPSGTRAPAGRCSPSPRWVPWTLVGIPVTLLAAAVVVLAVTS